MSISLPDRLIAVGFALSAWSLAACNGFSPYDSEPPGPSTPIGPGDGGPDASADGSPDATAAPTATGQLCLILDLRAPLACASNIDFTGVVIAQVGTDRDTTAAADGTFSLALEPGAFALLRVGEGSSTFATTVARIAVGDDQEIEVQMPTLYRADADAILANANVAPVASTGVVVALFSQLVGDAKVPRSDVSMAPMPMGATALYETLVANEWTTSAGQTGASGVALGVNVAPGLKSFGASYSSQTLSLTQVPIEADAWTFVTATFDM